MENFICKIRLCSKDVTTYNNRFSIILKKYETNLKLHLNFPAKVDKNLTWNISMNKSMPYFFLIEYCWFFQPLEFQALPCLWIKRKNRSGNEMPNHMPIVVFLNKMRGFHFCAVESDRTNLVAYR